MFPPSIRNQSRMSLLTILLFNFTLEGLASAIRQEKETIGIYIGKEEIKLYLQLTFLGRKSQRFYPKKWLIISEFSKVAGYRNTPKTITLLCTTKERVENKNLKSMTLTIIQKQKPRYPNKNFQNLDIENYKMLIK